ncbi:MAG: UDP-N-acetylmuramoyl-L-alanyl-D-glutamate--2,6-diaminopimelate ligase [Pseudanabaenaceae cyanobacterium]|jgi:UDP-N-acetylmuramoyl-L-alanyl-D-glutamate--2,6-diaminopimelate ligase
MELKNLLAQIDLNLLAHSVNQQNLDQGLATVTVERLVTDSRACVSGDLFIGMTGTNVDGGKFAPKAISQGAIAAVVSTAAYEHLQQISDKTNSDPTLLQRLIVVEDVTTACGQLAAAFYGNPATQMSLVGVTGTNGKTTTTHLIEFLLQESLPTALFGTLYTRWAGHSVVANYTTPFAVDLQASLAQAKAAGCQAAVMEVSSHALEQQRVLGCEFAAAVFTNLTQDHLDYHQTLEAYFAAKALLFAPNYLKGRAVINIDDIFGCQLVETVKASGLSCWTYGIDNQADFTVTDLRFMSHGVTGTIQTPLGTIPLNSPLVGRFNVANILAAVASAVHLGVSLETIANRLPLFASVPGRVEQVKITPDQDITVVVDYAHTPDSLENVLKALRPFVQRELICVFGCGGDRDRTKRPKMGHIAITLADQVYVTSDNPRTEDPARILADVVVGVRQGQDNDGNTRVPYVVEADRRQAIVAAITGAKPGDTVLIAGKGHEDYQILGTEKIHFDDREEAAAALALRG